MGLFSPLFGGVCAAVLLPAREPCQERRVAKPALGGQAVTSASAKVPGILAQHGSNGTGSPNRAGITDRDPRINAPTLPPP